MKERVSQLILSKGLTSSKFAELLDVQPSSISHILSGRNNPSYDFILKVLTVFTDVDPNWLLLGQGGIYREENEVKNEPLNDKSIDIDSNMLYETESDHHLLTESSPIYSSQEIASTTTPGVSTVVEGGVDSTPLVTTVNSKKRIERVLIFYSDKTFSEYSPE